MTKFKEENFQAVELNPFALFFNEGICFSDAFAAHTFKIKNTITAETHDLTLFMVGNDAFLTEHDAELSDHKISGELSELINFYGLENFDFEDTPSEVHGICKIEYGLSMICERYLHEKGIHLCDLRFESYQSPPLLDA